MDKERARFILSSFRPNGADTRDADFTEALQLAMEDRELGEWLASERAFDSAFADALGSIQLPGHLREDILTSLAIERGDFPQAEDSHDAGMIGALATIQPPAGFRDQILAAMEASAPAPKSVVPFWKKLGIPLAAAAGIALALLLTRQTAPVTTGDLTHIAESGPISFSIVQASFVKTYEAPDFSLEVTQQDYEQLVSHLCSCGLPHTEDLPDGLRHLQGVGCRELIVDGKHGSLICFNGGADGVIHLVIFRRQDIAERGPFDKPEITKRGEWAIARWQDPDHAFLLLGNVTPEKLAEMF